MAARASSRPPARSARRKTRRIRRPARALRWIGLVILLAVAVGYVQPLRAYREASANVAGRQAEVDRIARANIALETRIGQAGSAASVEREARRIGLVQPGERLFIVTGIDEWKQERRARAKARLR